MKPILFNSDMVRAILDNRKTVTRRLVKPQPTDISWQGAFRGDNGAVPVAEYPDGRVNQLVFPYHPGDILYVRETWCWCPCWDCGMGLEEGCADETATKLYNAEKSEWGCYGYRASPNPDEVLYDKWRPSIHMPREAARIFLRVTDVRVERLRKITIEGMRMEGVTRRGSFGGCACAWKTETCMNEPCPSRDAYEYACWVRSFIKVWNSTIKTANLPLYGWDANPWVWVIEFERISREETIP